MHAPTPTDDRREVRARDRHTRAEDAAWVASWVALVGLHVALVVLFVFAPQSLAFAIVAVLVLIVWLALGLL